MVGVFITFQYVFAIWVTDVTASAGVSAIWVANVTAFCYDLPKRCDIATGW